MANLERLKAQAATAGEKQALEQEQLNLAYQQFQEEQDYQRNYLNISQTFFVVTQRLLVQLKYNMLRLQA
jgi:hypothetical protein